VEENGVPEENPPKRITDYIPILILMSSTHIHCLKCSFNYYVHYTNVCKTNIDCWSTPSGHSCSLPGVLDTTLRDQFCQWLAAFRWIFFGYPVFLHQLNWSPRYNWKLTNNRYSFYIHLYNVHSNWSYILNNVCGCWTLI
jgi:hypothetical protein